MFEHLQFHFQQPFWLWVIIPLLLIVWLLKSKTSSAKSWEKVIDANLLPILIQGEIEQSVSKSKWLLVIAWLFTVVALADPVWEKIPRPVFQTNAARVIVLDLSNSMLVDDLKPTRMARARFKVEDILAKKEEGQIGLVVFAGDAFTAAPLTRDGETIRALLQVLTPRIMPSQGSRADLGLIKAHELLKQAGATNGQVLLITDGTSDSNKTVKAASSLKRDGHSVSILAVGTKEGGILKLNRQQQVTVKLEIDSLHKTAEKGGGVLHTITNSDADLLAVLASVKSNITDNNNTNSTEKNKQTRSDDLNSVDWKSNGPFIILLLLPLAALAFRKGWLFSVFISFSLITALTMPKPVMAASTEDNKVIQKLISENDEPAWQGFFKNLLKNKEQRAETAFQNQQYDEAQALTSNPLRAGSAAYKKGDYEQALESFKKSKDVSARYNEGNALAKLEKYEEAIKAYDEALKLQPEMPDAKKNKKALENFLKQQEQHKPEDQQSDKDSDQDQNKDSENQKNKQDGQKNAENKDKKQGEKDQKQSDEKGDQQQESKDGEDGDKKENQFSDANKEMDEKSDKDKEDGKTETDEKSAEEREADEKEAEKLSKSKPDDKETESDGAKEVKEAREALQKEGTKSEAEELNKEEKMAAEQWLRRIPDDPGGLLRRKFQRQYRQYKRKNVNENPW